VKNKIEFTVSILLTLALVACATPAAEPSMPSATETPSGPVLLEFPRGVCCEGRLMDPGVYKLPRWFSPTMTIEITEEGWRAVTENSVETVYMLRGSSDVSAATQVFAFFELEADQSLEQFQQDLLGVPVITLLDEPQASTIAGIEAWQLDAQALPNPNEPGDPGADIPPFTQELEIFEEYFTTTFYYWTTFSPEARIRVYTFNNGGQDIVIYIESPVDEFDSFAADAEAILQTLIVVE
jgi:hypothetical protein